MLDLFSGSWRHARALVRLGAPWVLCYDTKQDPLRQDLLLKAVQDEVFALLRAGAFAAAAAEPVCSSMSTAVTPAVHTARWPRGVPWMSDNMRPKVDMGNRFSRFVALLFGECVLLGLPAWVENPDGSWLWRQREWERLQL